MIKRVITLEIEDLEHSKFLQVDLHNLTVIFQRAIEEDDDFDIKIISLKVEPND